MEDEGVGLIENRQEEMQLHIQAREKSILEQVPERSDDDVSMSRGDSSRLRQVKIET